MPENGPHVQSTPRRPPPGPEPIDLRVLYEDDHLIVVDKPAGMVVHPTYKNWSGTLLNGLLWRVPAGTHPRIVTRLDRDTSGVVLVALAADVHARVQRDSSAGRVTKSYLAVVRGTPAPARGSIDAPLARSRLDRRRVVIDAAGRSSQTFYEVIQTTPGASLLRCELGTGRTHQIRVHLASRGWPIVGDAVYGEPQEGLARHALHAWRVTLPHPVTRAPLLFEAALPPDLRALVGSANQPIPDAEP